MTKLVKGSELTDKQKAQVLRAFGNRDTIECPWSDDARRVSGRTVERVPDAQWVNEHAFYIKKDGALADKPNHCEPVYMADQPGAITDEYEV